MDDITVLECVSELETPLICAVGHVDEKIFIKNIADKVAPTPNGLGTYFSNMVESVMQKRNKSRAVLIEEVKCQYIKQIETAEKQNKALQEQVEKMTKASADAQANFRAQSEAMTKQLTTLQDNLKKLNVTNEEQAKKFTENIIEMQKTNTALQGTVARLTAQNTQAATELSLSRNRYAELEGQMQKARNTQRLLAAISVIVIIVLVLLLAV